MASEHERAGSAASLTVRGDALRAKGDFDTALSAYSNALALDPRQSEARRGMIAILQMAHTTLHHPRLTSMIGACLADPTAYHEPLARPAALQIRLKYGLDRIPDLDGSAGEVLISALESDRLVLDLLARTIVVDAALENFLVRLRRRLLLDSATGGTALRVALALQCIHNEYAWWAESDEIDHVDRLVAAVHPEDDRGFAAAAMYVSPHELPIAAALTERPIANCAAELRPLVRAILERRAEQSILADIESFSDVADPVSRAVSAQYNANPYPRWLEMPYAPYGDALSWVRRKYPHMSSPPSGHPLQVLCAGCGTGRHALCLAAGYRGAEITAFDLSRRSLAYAIRRARELGFRNVRFLHGDILAIERVGRRFDVIESIGVLHHMADPAIGLARLASVLNPGGLLRIGLYGERPRREIAEARRRIADLRLDVSARSVRLFRHLLLTDAAYRDLAGIVERVDFFSISGTRDLLFHVQEHRFSIQGIRHMLEDSGLDFLGFENLGDGGGMQANNSRVAMRYLAEFPHDLEMRNLDNWAALELREPDLMLGSGFSGYIFWAQRRQTQ